MIRIRKGFTNSPPPTESKIDELYMKTIFLCIASVFMSCAGMTPKSKSPEGNLLHQSGKGFTLFLNRADTSFYLLQRIDSITVPAICSFDSYTRDSLSIKDLTTSQIIKYKIDRNIYGIGFYKGNEFFELLTDGKKGDINFRSNLADLIGLMSCLCHPISEIHTCAQGGTGTESCEFRMARKVGYDTWLHSCQINCNHGYSACCN